MNRKQTESDIVIAHTFNDYDKLYGIYVELVNSRSKLDRWFNKYLDMFDEKMSKSTREDPLWKLYHVKHEEYSDINQTIRTAEYYLKKA
jgi:hypothetical protein